MNEKYYVRKSTSEAWRDVVDFQGVRVLKVSGFGGLGKAVNIYTAQWVNSQAEDVAVTTLNAQQQPVVIRENVNVEITFAVSPRYATGAIDVQTQHDAFVDYMTSSPLYIRSLYANRDVYCVCLESYKPTMQKLHRGFDSYMTGTITLHTLNAPSPSVVY